MNIRRHAPWSICGLMRRESSPLVRRRSLFDDDGTVADWIPAVDIVEEKDRFVLKADMPGVDPRDIDVSMNGGVLSLSGIRREETKSEPPGRRRLERISGKFYRCFTLPETADAEGIAASSNNGILEVTIPKLPEVQPRRITVEAA